MKKVIFITGAAQGIGLITANHLASLGYVVFAGIRKTSNCEKLNEYIKIHHDNLKSIVCDVISESSIETAIHHVLNEAGTIDILINNACLVYWGTSEVCTIEEQQKSMDVNYFSVVRMLQNVLPIMRKQKSGKIINISSVAGFEAFPSIETYVATKFALEGLSESLAIYLKSFNIHVSLIEPGAVNTGIAAHSRVGSRHVSDTKILNTYAEQSHEHTKSGQIHSQDPNEIAKMIEEICKSENPHFRYQSSDEIQKRATNRFIDPTGDRYIEEKQAELQI